MTLFNNKFQNQIVSLLILFFSKIALAILGPPHFHINFKISLSICMNKPAWVLIGIALNL